MAWCKARAARVLSKAAREAGWLCLRDPASGQAIRRLVELGLKVKGK